MMKQQLVNILKTNSDLLKSRTLLQGTFDKECIVGFPSPASEPKVKIKPQVTQAMMYMLPIVSTSHSQNVSRYFRKTEQ